MDIVFRPGMKPSDPSRSSAESIGSILPRLLAKYGIEAPDEPDAVKPNYADDCAEAEFGCPVLV